MATSSNVDGRGLRQAIEATQRQLGELAGSVAELTAAVKVEDVKRSDLERRVLNLETGENNDRNRIVTVADQRRLSTQMAFVSAGCSIVISIIILALSHINWK